MGGECPGLAIALAAIVKGQAKKDAHMKGAKPQDRELVLRILCEPSSRLA